MNIEVNIDAGIAEEVTRKNLEEHLISLEGLGTIDEVPLYDAMMEVLAYFSTKDQMLKFSERKVPPLWTEIVLMHDEEKKKEALEKGMAKIREMFPGAQGVGILV